MSTRGTSTKQKSPEPKGAGAKNCGRFRQFAAAPALIISPDAGVIIANAATKAAPDAEGAAESAGVRTSDMRPNVGLVRSSRQASACNLPVNVPRARRSARCLAASSRVFRVGPGSWRGQWPRAPRPAGRAGKAYPRPRPEPRSVCSHCVLGGTRPLGRSEFGRASPTRRRSELLTRELR